MPLRRVYDSHMFGGDGEIAATVVWVVDDDPSVVTAVSRLLRSAALEVVGMRSGFELRSRLEHSVPDCLLMDLWLGDVTGLELLAGVQERAGHVPVVFLSADADVS